MKNKMYLSVCMIMLMTATATMAQARRGRGFQPPGGRGGPRGGGTESLVDEMSLTSIQQGMDARAALMAYDRTVREQTLQARQALLEKMQTILSADQLSRFKDQLEQIPLVPALPPQARGIATTDLVDRAISFDKNQDGKVSRDELPERMLSLMNEGDANHDGALDKEELKGLADHNSVNDQPPGRGGRGRRGGGRNQGPPPRSQQ